MALVTNVKAARKDQGKCGKCGAEIKKGDSYRHASPGFRSRKKIRCLKFECRFRQSDLTTSKLSSLYAAQEDAENALAALDDSATADDLKSIADDVATAAEEVAEEYREASQAWADGQGHEEWDEWADTLDSYAEELQNLDIPEPEEDDDAEEELAWLDEQREAVESAIGDFSL